MLDEDGIEEGIEPPEEDADGNQIVAAGGGSGAGKLHTLGRMSVSTYVIASKAEANRQLADNLRQQHSALNARLEEAHKKVADARRPMRMLGRKQLVRKPAARSLRRCARLEAPRRRRLPNSQSSREQASASRTSFSFMVIGGTSFVSMHRMCVALEPSQPT